MRNQTLLLVSFFGLFVQATEDGGGAASGPGPERQLIGIGKQLL